MLPLLLVAALAVLVLPIGRAAAQNGGAGTPRAQPVQPAEPLANPFAADGGDPSKQCGKSAEPGAGGKGTYNPVIDLGCQGENYQGNELNPIMDVLFALLRFLTVGIGLVAIASIIFAGIQFTTSQGDPARTAKAIGRIGTTVGALFLYIVAWALLNWLVPGGIFNG